MNLEKERITNPPYTLIGNTHIPDEYTVVLDGKGLKKIVEKLEEDEDLEIVIYSSNRKTEFNILRKCKKEK